MVEDEPLVALDVEATLEELGFTDIKHAPTLEKAMTLATSNDFDLALLDYNLNGKPSLPIAEHVHGKGTQIVFTSGYELTEELLTKFGARQLGKPFSSRQLEVMLSDLKVLSG